MIVYSRSYLLHGNQQIFNKSVTASDYKERAKHQVVRAFPNAIPEEQARVCEHAAILISLENLLTFPCLKERVVAEKLDLHGWYFDVESGNLSSCNPTKSRFELLA